MTHGKYNQLVYNANSVFDKPSRVYIMTLSVITAIYGTASAKYKVGIQA